MGSRTVFMVVLKNDKDQTIKDLFKKEKRQIMNQMKFYDYCDEFDYGHAEEVFDNIFLNPGNFYYDEFEPKYVSIYDAKKGEVFICLFFKNTAGGWESLNILRIKENNSDSTIQYYGDGIIYVPT
jgi:hypothetical protein